MGKQLRKEGRRWRDLLAAASMSVVFLCCSALGEDGAASPVAARFRVHPMKKISAERGVEYLEEVGIDVTTSKLKGTNTLLVTSDNQLALAKASAVLNLVDSDDKYVVTPIATAAEANDLPSPDALQKLLPDAAVGTFLSPPRGERPVKAIMDFQGDMVIVIAPANHLERIFAAVNRYRTKVKAAGPAPAIGPTAKVVIGPNDVLVEGGPMPEVKREESYQDELFGDLMESLDTERTKQRPARRQAAAPEGAEPLVLAAEQAAEAAEAAAESDEELVEQLRRLMEERGEAEGEIVLGPEEEAEVVEIDGKEVTLPEVGREREDIRSYEPTFDFDPEEEIPVTLPETFEVMLLLDLVGKYLNLDYIYDAQELKGVTVNMKLNGALQGSLKLGQLYPLAETVLMSKGFVMTRYGNVVWIRKKEAVWQGPGVPIIDDGGRIEAGDVMVNRVFKLEYIDTTNAKNLLENMQLGEQITEVPEQGALFVVGYTSQMPRIEQLLSIVDKPGKPKKFRFRQLKYTMADAIAPKIQSLAEELGTVSITIAQATPTVAAAPTRGRPIPRGVPPRPTVPQAAGAAAATPSAPTVYLDADARTNRILMIGLDEQLDIVEELVDALDVEQQDLRTLRLYDMQYVEAEDVRAKLEELGIVSALRQTSRSITASRMRGAQQQAAAARAAQPGQPGVIPPTTTPGETVEEILSEEPQVVIIEATNSLLVNATPAQQAHIAMIIGYVDSETLEAAKPYRIYRLENQKPEEMAKVLKELIQESVQDQAGKIEQVRRTEEEIVIVPDDATFSLIVYASKKNQEWLEAMIQTLDRRRPQVLIDVTLVSVRRTDQFEIDMEIASNLGQAAENTVVAQITPFTENSVTELFSSPIVTDPDFRSQAFYGDKNIQFLLTAMQQKSYGRVLAKPKILVNDGQAGTIQTLETTNVAITSTIVPDEGTAQTATDFREYEAGLTLTITPNISEGDLLLLEVELIRSSFLPRTDTSVPPDKTESNINTIVTVPNNRTIILGGVIGLDQTKGGNKVPILGDIPILGGLFRSINNSDIESKLYIFVKANILRPLEDIPGLPELETISAENREAFEEFETRFQEYESWPGIKGEPMPPVKVLEAR